MPILMRFGRQLSAMALFAGLVACDRESPAYSHIKDLPEAQWDSYASTLPIGQRLDLHKEIMNRSGHNPTMTIRLSFSSQPEETYKAINLRLKSGDKSRYYSTILYEIDGRRKFKICSQPDRKVIQDYLWSIATDAVKNEDRPDFYRC